MHRIQLPFPSEAIHGQAPVLAKNVLLLGESNNGLTGLSPSTPWIHVDTQGSLELKLNGKSSNKVQLSVTIAGVTKTFTVSSGLLQRFDVGVWNLTDTGYISIQLKAISSSENRFPDISEYVLSGSSINKNTAFVKNNEGNFFYWGRRGPSVHLKYDVPDSARIEWFYNEITVSQNEDVVGSYYMANGFSGGYFGIQVNSETERRILFSVWSPFATDDPKKIPADKQVILLKKGKDVVAGEFGNEGSGGQSYMRYKWKAGNTYRFLLNAVPLHNGNTIFTAYFFTPETNKWMLIASFRRPETNSFLKGLHSFLENFIPMQGALSRRASFSNQWYFEYGEGWKEISRATFTYDNTAAKGYRLDYTGGIESGQFFLKNGGFFNHRIPYKTILERKAGGHVPQIDFSDLPQN